MYFTVGYQNHAPEWWQNSGTRQDSTKVVVAQGELTNLDTELALAGKITGTIAQAVPAQGTLKDGIVEAWVADSTYPLGRYLAGSSVTADDGSYTITGLHSGAYQLHFYTRISKVEGWWQGQSTFSTATPVAVTAPNTVADISPTGLLPLKSITGQVTSATNGTPLAEVRIAVYRKRGEYWVQDPRAVADRDTRTAADGTYSIDATQQGIYRLMAYWPNSHFRSGYWNGATSLATAQDIVISTNQVTPNIDLALEQIDPINEATPTVNGTRRVGSVLTVANGTWTPAASTFTYQWMRNGMAIAGATQKSYTLRVADLGKSIAVRVTANYPGMTPATVRSWATSTIASGVFHPTSKPSIIGILKVTNTLRAIRPQTSTATVATYRWLRNGRPISGAQAATYKLVKSDKNKRIGVRITLTRPGYATVIRVVTRRSTVR